MWRDLWNEPELKIRASIKWKDRSLWWWIGVVVVAYIAIVIAAVAVNAIFPAPRRVGIAGPGCVLESAMVFYHACDGFPGAKAVEIFRNLPMFSWLIPGLALFGVPFPVLYVTAFVVLVVAIAWCLRALAKAVSGRTRSMR